MLVDFGKATFFSESKRYFLSSLEKQQYMRQYPHISPELIEGEMKQTVNSDIFSFGKLLFEMIDYNCISDLTHHKKSVLISLAEQCICSKPFSCLQSRKALEIFKGILD